MKKKMVMYVLGAMMVGGLAMSNPSAMAVNAAEADEPMVVDEVGDILDGIFGGDKPDYTGGDEGEDYGHGEGYQPSTPDSDSGSTGGSGNSNDFNSQPTPPSQPETPSQPNNGGNGGNSGNTGNTGSSNQGNNGGITVPGGNGGSGNVTLPGNGNLPTGGNGGVAGNGNVGTGNGGVVVTPPTTATGCVTVPVVDKNLLAVFPDAMYVYTPEGAVSFNSLDATKMTYNVWVGGQIANQFAIVDAKNNLVALSAPQIVNDGTGKTYVNVTVPEGTAGAKVLATEAQKSAFTRLYGIDGVMVNGVLVEAFQNTVRN